MTNQPKEGTLERKPKTVRLLFSDEMARAIVEGRKTVTRRPCEAYDAGLLFRVPHGVYVKTPDETTLCKSICAPGDLLIGRECWAAIAPDPEGDDIDPIYEYRADHSPPLRKPGGWDDAEPGDPDMVHWRQSIHMPDAAARIRRRVLGVTGVRLQDITEVDAVREGFAPREPSPPVLRHHSARDLFFSTWDSIYAAKGLGRTVNPWVWRIEFSAENVPVE